MDEVVFLDKVTAVIHRPSNRHLVAKCGLDWNTLDYEVMIGLERVLMMAAEHYCMDCFPQPDKEK